MIRSYLKALKNWMPALRKAWNR
ncbi:unnamed protein product [Acanthoscelides obtectus]|uniref:Uncharacterized protein n=1 Tax=Acanthoscelides obtectus TaxID=200917 RepID=A0A9P0M6H2_ACAOB|nr:unnamed protein product [Acanthoscelides obtectus]CAK1672186.1 hypothetical protein AOBTE_LOCUS28703 [Acanthoscelides obtectus]